MLTVSLQWVDEDEQDEAQEDDYAANFGGFGEDGGLGGIDFSKLGGGAGLDMAGAEGAGEEEEEDVRHFSIPISHKTEDLLTVSSQTGRRHARTRR